MIRILLFDVEDPKSTTYKEDIFRSDVVGVVDENGMVFVMKSRNAEAGKKMSLKKFGKRAVKGKI